MFDKNQAMCSIARLKETAVLPFSTTLTPLDRSAIRSGLRYTIYCPCCGNISYTTNHSKNLRETLQCEICGATNRQRQLSAMIASLYGYTSLAEMGHATELVIYNTECSRCLHDMLKHAVNYQCSEYLPSPYTSNYALNGVQHQNLEELTFDSDSIDLVITTDVMEHVGSATTAFKEIYRVLRQGGHHVFTLPFLVDTYTQDTRAVAVGKTVQYLKDKVFHDDPCSPDGSLVFRHFALDLLPQLEFIGFKTQLFKLYEPELGILGPDAFVFISVKE